MTERIIHLHKERMMFWTLLAILVLCAGFYMYCVKTTISNIVIRQNLESEASALTLSIGNQEFQYITKVNSVTRELAYSLGFKDVEPKVFISRASNASEVAFLSR